MATFEPTSQRKSSSVETFPYKRLDPTVRKFVKVLEVDLDRLSRHRSNIEKYQTFQQWDLLNKEQINSSRTVKQLKATMRQLEHTRAQVQPEDLAKFDENISGIQQRTVGAIMEFLDINFNDELEPLVGVSQICKGPLLENEENASVSQVSIATAENDLFDPGTRIRAETDTNAHSLETLQQKQLLSAKVASAEGSWNDLRTSLVELNSLVHEFSTVVHSQQEMVNRIEDNIELAQVNVEQGAFHLGAAAKLKGAVFPVAGALIGGVLGGPVGLVAGVKLGGLAAVTGGVAGFTGGHFLKKHQNRTAEVEMQKLSSRNNRTLPDVVSQPLNEDVSQSLPNLQSFSDAGS